MECAVYLLDKELSKPLIYRHDKSGHYSRMKTVYQVRLENLRALMIEAGGSAETAQILDRERSQLSQMAGRTPTRNIGNKTARWIEKQFGKPEGWMDTQHLPEPKFSMREERAGEYNVTRQRQLRRVPMLTWIQAGMWREAVNNMAPSVPAIEAIGPQAYALKVLGDSMINPSGAPSFPEGTMIIVDPELVAKPGDFVVVRQRPGEECTFKQLAHDAGKSYLKPLNPRYPLIELAAEAEICGVLVEARINFKGE